MPNDNTNEPRPHTNEVGEWRDELYKVELGRHDALSEYAMGNFKAFISHHITAAYEKGKESQIPALQEWYKKGEKIGLEVGYEKGYKEGLAQKDK